MNLSDDYVSQDNAQRPVAEVCYMCLCIDSMKRKTHTTAVFLSRAVLATRVTQATHKVPTFVAGSSMLANRGEATAG
jgi:hypothetical protein